MKNYITAINESYNSMYDKRKIEEHHDGDFPQDALQWSVADLLDEMKDKAEGGHVESAKMYEEVESWIKDYFKTSFKKQFKELAEDYIRNKVEPEIQQKWFNLLVEYIDEAEHQDGYEYWDNFANPQEALEDYILFADNYVEI